MCGQRGRAAIWHARPSRVRRAAEAGGKVFRHGRSAFDELPGPFAELIIEEVALEPGHTAPPGEPEAAA